MRISEIRNQKSSVLNEHIAKYPRTKEDFNKLEQLLLNPITGSEGIRAITEIIHDTSLIDVLTHQLANDQNFVMNDVIIDWVRTNMPHAITHAPATDSYYSPLSNLNKDV